VAHDGCQLSWKAAPTDAILDNTVDDSNVFPDQGLASSSREHIVAIHLGKSKSDLCRFLSFAESLQRFGLAKSRCLSLVRDKGTFEYILENNKTTNIGLVYCKCLKLGHPNQTRNRWLYSVVSLPMRKAASLPEE